MAEQPNRKSMSKSGLPAPHYHSNGKRKSHGHHHDRSSQGSSHIGSSTAAATTSSSTGTTTTTTTKQHRHSYTPDHSTHSAHSSHGPHQSHSSHSVLGAHSGHSGHSGHSLHHAHSGHGYQRRKSNENNNNNSHSHSHNDHNHDNDERRSRNSVGPSGVRSSGVNGNHINDNAKSVRFSKKTTITPATGVTTAAKGRHSGIRNGHGNNNHHNNGNVHHSHDHHSNSSSNLHEHSNNGHPKSNVYDTYTQYARKNSNNNNNNNNSGKNRRNSLGATLSHGTKVNSSHNENDDSKNDNNNDSSNLTPLSRPSGHGISQLNSNLLGVNGIGGINGGNNNSTYAKSRYRDYSFSSSYSFPQPSKSVPNSASNGNNKDKNSRKNKLKNNNNDARSPSNESIDSVKSMNAVSNNGNGKGKGTGKGKIDNQHLSQSNGNGNAHGHSPSHSHRDNNTFYSKREMAHNYNHNHNYKSNNISNGHGTGNGHTISLRGYSGNERDKTMNTIKLMESDINSYVAEFDRRTKKKYNFVLFRNDYPNSRPIQDSNLRQTHRFVIQHMKFDTPIEYHQVLFQKIAGISSRDEALPDYIPPLTALGTIITYNESLFTPWNLAWLGEACRLHGLHRILDKSYQNSEEYNALDEFDRGYTNVSHSFMTNNDSGYGNRKSRDILLFEQLYVIPQRNTINHFSNTYDFFRKLGLDVDKEMKQRNCKSQRPSLSLITTKQEQIEKAIEKSAMELSNGRKSIYFNKKNIHKRNSSICSIGSIVSNLSNDSNDDSDSDTDNNDSAQDSEIAELEAEQIDIGRKVSALVTNTEFEVKSHLRLGNETKLKEFEQDFDNLMSDLRKAFNKKKAIVMKIGNGNDNSNSDGNTNDDNNNNNDNDCKTRVETMEKDLNEASKIWIEKRNSIITAHRRYSLTKLNFNDTLINETNKEFGKNKTYNTNYTHGIKKSFINDMKNFEKDFDEYARTITYKLGSNQSSIESFGLIKINNAKSKAKPKSEEKGNEKENDEDGRKGNLSILGTFLESIIKFIKDNIVDSPQKGSLKYELYSIRNKVKKYESRKGNVTKEERQKIDEIVKNMDIICDNINKKFKSLSEKVSANVNAYNKYEHERSIRENCKVKLLQVPFEKCKNANDHTAKKKGMCDDSDAPYFNVFMSRDQLTGKSNKRSRMTEHCLKISFPKKRYWIYNDETAMMRGVGCILFGSYQNLKVLGSKVKHSIYTYHNDNKQIDGHLFVMTCLQVNGKATNKDFDGIVRPEEKRTLRSYAQVGQLVTSSSWHKTRSQSVADVHSRSNYPKQNRDIKTRRTVTENDVLTSKK